VIKVGWCGLMPCDRGCDAMGPVAVNAN
jgi:hypothetical protein